MKDDDFEPSPIVDEMGKVELESVYLEFPIYYVEFEEAPIIELPGYILDFEEALLIEFLGYIVEFEEAQRLNIKLHVAYILGWIMGVEN